CREATKKREEQQSWTKPPRPERVFARPGVSPDSPSSSLRNTYCVSKGNGEHHLRLLLGSLRQPLHQPIQNLGRKNISLFRSSFPKFDLPSRR
ncbi:hypothetical protein V3C99_015444, partial [Haemonchus contortus]